MIATTVALGLGAQEIADFHLRDALACLAFAPDAVAGALAPTRATILDALDGLVSDTEADDDVLIHLSGHGAQVPAPTDDPAPDEPDGLDEVFLPSDFAIGRESDVFRNPLRDYEIGVRIDHMMQTGATVWLVADTCHAGSPRRSGAASAAARMVDLGTGEMSPAAREPVAGAPLGAPCPARRAAGDFIGSYAAAPGSLAYETASDDGAGEEAHDLLTWAPTRSHRRENAACHGDLAPVPTADLWQDGRGLADPGFTGSPDRRNVWSRAGGRGRERAFRVKLGDTWRLAGGRIDGLVSGARILIGRNGEAPLLETEVLSAGPTEAHLAIPEGAVPVLDAVIAAEDLDPDRVRWRWLTDRVPALTGGLKATAFDLALAITLPDPGSIPMGLDRSFERTVVALAPSVRTSAGHAEAVMAYEKGRLHLRPADPGASGFLSVAATAGRLPDFAAILRRLARARALLHVARGFETRAISRGLAASLTVFPGARESDDRCRTRVRPNPPGRREPSHPRSDTATASMSKSPTAAPLPSTSRRSNSRRTTASTS